MLNLYTAKSVTYEIPDIVAALLLHLAFCKRTNKKRPTDQIGWSIQLALYLTYPPITCPTQHTPHPSNWVISIFLHNFHLDHITDISPATPATSSRTSAIASADETNTRPPFCAIIRSKLFSRVLSS